MALIVLACKTLTKSLSPTRAIILIKLKEELSNFIIVVGWMVGKVYAKLHPIIPSGYRDIALIVLARKTLTKSLSPTRAIILIKLKEELSNFIIVVGWMVGKVYAKLHPIIPSGYRDIALIVLARKTLTKV